MLLWKIEIFTVFIFSKVGIMVYSDLQSKDTKHKKSETIFMVSNFLRKWLEFWIKVGFLYLLVVYENQHIFMFVWHFKELVAGS